MPAKRIGDGVYAVLDSRSANVLATACLDEDIGLIYQTWQISERLRRSQPLAFESAASKHKGFDRNQAAKMHAPLYRT
jgi:hypothetical protein